MLSQPHNTHLKVRGYELDSYGHVNNAVYLQYYEQARWEAMHDLGMLDRISGNGLAVVVTESLVRYMRELCLFDEIVVETRYETASPYLIFQQRIIRVKDQLAVSRATIKTVFIGPDKVPADIPEFLIHPPEEQK